MLSSEMLDLEEIVTKWLEFFRKTTRPGCFTGLFRNSRGKYLPLTDLEVDINWDKVKFTQEDVRFINDSNDTRNLSELTLFQSSFENRTNQNQETWFKFNHETIQSYEISFSKGCSKGQNFTLSKVSFLENIIKLVVPEDILEFNVGLTKQVQTICGQNNKQDSKSKENRLDLYCDTKVSVKSMTRARASLKITELKMERKFSGVAFIEGRIVIVLNHPKYGFVQSVSVNICDVFRVAIEKNWLPAMSKQNYVLTTINQRKGVRFEFEGICRFRLGFNQVVDVVEEEL